MCVTHLLWRKWNPLLQSCRTCAVVGDFPPSHWHLNLVSVWLRAWGKPCQSLPRSSGTGSLGIRPRRRGHSPDWLWILTFAFCTCVTSSCMKEIASVPVFLTSWGWEVGQIRVTVLPEYKRAVTVFSFKSVLGCCFGWVC